MVTKDDIIKVLKKIEDPELQLDLWTLGLIYEVKIKKDIVDIIMTFTTYACPYGPMLLEEVNKKVTAMKGIKKTNIELTFEPPWQPSEELRAMLGV